MFRYFPANKTLYKCQLGTFESPGVMWKAADICAFSVCLITLKIWIIFWKFREIADASSALLLHHYNAMGSFKPITDFCLFPKSVLHVMLLWRKLNICVKDIDFCALILPIPLPDFVGSSTQGMWPQRTIPGWKIKWRFSQSWAHGDFAPQHAGLLMRKLSKIGNRDSDQEA